MSMDPGRVVAAAIFGIPALLLMVYVSFTARGKGPILSNAWIFLTPEQKKREDKRPHYKLVTVVFGMLALALVFLTLQVLTDKSWCGIVAGVLIAADLIYAIADAVKTEKMKH